MPKTGSTHEGKQFLCKDLLLVLDEHRESNWSAHVQRSRAVQASLVTKASVLVAGRLQMKDLFARQGKS